MRPAAEILADLLAGKPVKVGDRELMLFKPGDGHPHPHLLYNAEVLVRWEIAYRHKDLWVFSDRAEFNIARLLNDLEREHEKSNR